MECGVGRLIYNVDEPGFEMDDRLLTHLRVVLTNKLRRKESFMLTLSNNDKDGRRSVWIHPSIPLVYHFSGSRPARINPLWVEQLDRSASSADGLHVMPEPPQRTMR